MDVQAPKRTACDRCRDQKLKCLRSQRPENPCDRCIRLGTVCTTSKGKPLGRPRLNNSTPTSRRVDCNQTTGTQGRRESSLGDLGLPSASNPPSSPSQFLSTSNVGPEPTPTLFSSESETDFLATQFGDFDAAAAIDPGILSPWSQPWLYPDSSLVPSFDPVNQEASHEANNTIPKGVTKNAGFFDPSSSEASKRSASLDGDPAAPLVGVMRSISRQLADLKGRTWNPSLMLVKLFGGKDPDFNNPGNLNPLEDAMHISMKFVMVLQMMTPLEHSTALQPCSPPTLPISLMLLSTYLQLCQLFEAILTEIQESLQGASPHGDRSANMFENRAQSSTQPEITFVKMIIQCFEHQLNSVESLMGLPARYRLWSQQKSSNGILDDNKIFPLTEAVMDQAVDIFQSLKRTVERIQIILML